MADKTMTPQEWLDKVAWEGGLLEAFEYGLGYYDLDDSDPTFNDFVREMYDAFMRFDASRGEFDDYVTATGYDYAP